MNTKSVTIESQSSENAEHSTCGISRRDALGIRSGRFVRTGSRRRGTPSNAPVRRREIHPFSFYDEGPERMLDLLQETAGVNALLIYSHLYAADQSVPKAILAHDHPGFTPVEPSLRRYRRVWARHSDEAFRGMRLQHPSQESNVEFAGKDLFVNGG